MNRCIREPYVQCYKRCTSPLTSGGWFARFGIGHSCQVVTVLFFLILLLSHKKPNSPETVEEISTVSFDWLINSCWSKASKLIKMDIVKPIPPKSPIPKISVHLICWGKEQIFAVTAKKLNKKIPRGLPIINPVKMPRLFECPKFIWSSPSIIIAVLANANKGKMINATGL